jgi:hypothetical protein
MAILRQRASELNGLVQSHLWSESAGSFVNKMPARPYNLSEDAFYSRISPTSFYPLMTGTATAAQAKRMSEEHLLQSSGFCITPAPHWPPTPAAPANDAVMLQSWTLPPAAAAAGGGSEGESGDGGGRSGVSGNESNSEARVVLCTVPLGSDAATASVGGCEALRKGGASFHRNESVVWSVPLNSSFRRALSNPSATPRNDTVARDHQQHLPQQPRIPLFLYRAGSSGSGGGTGGSSKLSAAAAASNEDTVLGRKGDFPAADLISPDPVVMISSAPHVPGAWPLKLWSSAASGAVRQSHATALSGGWRLTGGPNSDTEVSNIRDAAGQLAWQLNRTLGWTDPLSTACHWGLPSISFDDSAFGSPGGFVYWRGNAWAPLAMLTCVWPGRFQHLA